ncbi:MAG: hypothetical protein WC593_11525 [Methanoregula sp.]
MKINPAEIDLFLLSASVRCIPPGDTDIARHGITVTAKTLIPDDP